MHDRRSCALKKVFKNVFLTNLYYYVLYPAFFNKAESIPMNEMNREESPLANFMAAVGLVVMICLLAWLAVQFVRLVPSVFSKLAAVFEENQRELQEKADDNEVVVVNDGSNDSEGSDIEGETPTSGSDTKVDDEIVKDSDSTSVVPESKPTTPTPAPVTYKTVVTYKQPVSDPNGYVDLFASFAAVGTMTANGRFLAADHLNEDEPGAFQFKVKNNGTKTSGEWRFKIELPNGNEIESQPQRPLGPSETSTLTIAFDGIEDRNDRDISIEVTTNGDINTTNNSFKVRVDVK